MNVDDLTEYLRAAEPHKRERAGNWRVAIGLQKVDGLSTSPYLVDAARRNIEGELTLPQVREMLDGYYKAKGRRAKDQPRTEEADKVSHRIAEILAEPAFSFTPSELVSIHGRLFGGLFRHAGRMRDYNITKKEWVLRGDTVYYASADSLRETLEYDFARERDFSYAKISRDKAIQHLSKFVSGVWQIHPFGEGNTRTTAVFFIKYLRSLGFDVSNAPFSEHAWFFRNALVRANYNNMPKGIAETTVFLDRFLENLLFGTKHALRNRELLVGIESDAFADAESRIDSPASDPTSSPTSNPASSSTGNPVPSLSPQLRALLSALDGEMSRKHIMKALGLKDRVSFAERYLGPALRIGYVEQTQPDSPRSPTQKYRLAEKGIAVRASLAPPGPSAT